MTMRNLRLKPSNSIIDSISSLGQSKIVRSSSIFSFIHYYTLLEIIIRVERYWCWVINQLAKPHCKLTPLVRDCQCGRACIGISIFFPAEYWVLPFFSCLIRLHVYALDHFPQFFEPAVVDHHIVDVLVFVSANHSDLVNLLPLYVTKTPKSEPIWTTRLLSYLFGIMLNNRVLTSVTDVKCTIYTDIVGENELGDVEPSSYANTHVVMLCFSVDQPNSLVNAENKWLDRIIEKCPGVKICLLGKSHIPPDLFLHPSDKKMSKNNYTMAQAFRLTTMYHEALRCDLRDDPKTHADLANRGQTPIDYEKGLAAARRVRASRYLECSARRNRGVSEAFLEVARVSISKSRHLRRTKSSPHACVIS
ncbi:hypothetical protein VP01_670g6 [Puccinia sorghi]|uniref:Uncharacterized protein n=1 Tax=Puccinia sorghi TaxID=27349 RepID=A0A0L6UER3_9BASI|nr:hypothetical protein VP01_670g6 [Puccinia sorghi]